jgi:hypothetical protein
VSRGGPIDSTADGGVTMAKNQRLGLSSYQSHQHAPRDEFMERLTLIEAVSAVHGRPGGELDCYYILCIGRYTSRSLALIDSIVGRVLGKQRSRAQIVRGRFYLRVLW